MICRECGARIDDDATECKFCGALYGTAEQAQESAESAGVAETEENVEVAEETYGIASEKDEIDELFDENEAKRLAQVEKIRTEKQSQLEEIEQRRKSRKRKQRLNILLVIVLLMLVGVAIVAGIGYFNYSYIDDENDSVVIVTPNPTYEPIKTEEPEETATPEATETALPDETELPVVGEGVIDSAETDNSVYATPAPLFTKKPAVTQSKPVATKKPAVVQPKPVATKKPVTADSTKKTIASSLITGGEIIKADGKTYMSFKYNNKWYYAKVSDNTTTESIAWKPMTISGYSNGETYNGVAVYTLTKMIKYEGFCVMPDSGTRLLTEADLAGRTLDELRLARNEIFARHGRKFSDPYLQDFFGTCSWYKEDSNYNYANDNANLNSIEKQNVAFIMSYENKLK